MQPATAIISPVKTIARIALLVASGALSGQQLEQALHEAVAVQLFDAATVSPDGRHVAWIERIRPKDGAIYVSSVAPGAKDRRRITAGDGQQSFRENAFAWAPSSDRIAFLSDANSRGQLNLYITDVAGGPARRVTDLKGHASTVKWSPDGKSIAILFIENAPREAGPLVAGTRQVGVIESKIYEQRIAVIDSERGEVRQVSPADMYIYEYEWAPDSRSFAAIGAHGDGDNNWWIAQLYTVDAASGKTTSIHKPDLQIAIPRWSPDGKRIAFITGIMSDEGSVGGDIYLVNAGGGPAKNLTPGIKMSPSSLQWTSNEQMIFTATSGGSTVLSTLNVTNGSTEMLWKGDETLKAAKDAGVSFSGDRRQTATIRASWSQPPEVWTGPVGKWDKLTSANADRKPLWGEVQSISWTNENFTAQGWLMYPKDFVKGQRYPMVVSVHGGPASARKASWPDENDVVGTLSSRGYFVLLPNPRGSYGQGSAFTRANIKDFGGGDLRDILDGVDHVLKAGNVDPHRIGITGWSYGGFMTMWAVTQTNRFRAAVAGAGISNWKSYYGQNAIDQWMIPYFGSSVYDNPAVYAKSSPIEYIKNVKTPTLILVGERDSECPAPQSFEFWHALKTLGVPTELVVYEDEGHAILKPEHRLDRLKRTLDWFDQQMKIETPRTDSVQ
jgi:dipeptidyl aminopeptidase/acylaminoacyl peptidase